MILALAAKGKKTIAYTMLALMYFETIVPSYALGASRITYPRIILPVDKKAVNAPALKAAIVEPAAIKKAEGGPTQPESQQFSSVNSDNMVDLFSGDMSYSIPLLDVGGYPLAIGYNSGITMDQEASWTGLGWNINPGSITRNMRGLPDDFNGLDSIKKTATVKENKTIGVTGGADIEVVGFPLNVSASLGIFHNTYRGWGIEKSLGASISSGKNGGSMTAGLSLTDNSQEGLTISPSLGVGLSVENSKEDGGFSGNLSTSVSYNTRSGLKALQYSGGVTSYKRNEKTIETAKAAAVTAANEKAAAAGGKPGSVPPAPVPGWTGMSGSSSVFSSSISYAFPSCTPTINMPYTSKMLTITAKVGFETKVVHPNFFISGYTTKQWIADEDKVLYLPAYGYLNYQNGVRNPGALLDFNREKEIVYREKPAIPNIAMPGYTYDVFTISGEGIGGSFRAYRGDIGFVYDHSMRTRDASTNVSADVGFGDVLHVGANVNYTRSFTETGPWRVANPLANTVGFTKSDKTYEAVYFKNPGEKTINTSSFYDAIGGDSVVIPKLYQSGDNTPDIASTNYLTKYGGGKTGTDVLLTAANAVKPARDKRTQVISYLTAKEASTVGASTYIENYPLNKFQVQKCGSAFPESVNTDSIGFKGEYYSDTKLNHYLFTRNDTSINFVTKEQMQAGLGTPPPINENFSVRWTARLKAPVTGTYTVSLLTDDGGRLFVNDSLFMNFWNARIATRTCTMNLEAGEIYNVRLEYVNGVTKASAVMKWTCDTLKLTAKDFFLPTAVDTFEVVTNADTLHKELRVNAFRKANHISEIDVLNTDGQRYFYGLPVYNIKQKESTFSVKSERGNTVGDSVAYNDGIDNTINNPNGNDHYFTSEEVPAYAHSFLLTGIVSSDYADITGNGISDDDPGNAVKFNYSKVAGAKNPYKWRTPYSKNANYNRGLKSDTRDDKGSYVYGEKELWYLNSIESKNMIATFTVENRDDLSPINEKGEIDTGSHVAKRLKEINLYTKADFLKRNVKATPVKTVHFEYTYELCKGINGSLNNTGKLTLKRIWFSYNGNKKGQKNAYVFNYNAKNPDYDHKSFDRWGNYKDAADNQGYTSSNQVTNAENPYSLQDSAKAAANAAAWTLDSIVLPSGGRMKITYESDDYAYVQHHRAAQMFNVAGFSHDEPVNAGSLKRELYSSGATDDDNLYVAVNVPEAVSSKEDVYNKYIAGLDASIAFRLNVQMPSDKFGSGYEFVPSYGRLDKDNYGFIDDGVGRTIWFKVSGITKQGEDGGHFSPMAKSAVQFLRINLPSKAYPGSDVGDNLDLADGVKVMASMADNIKNAFYSYDVTARKNGWAKNVDLNRSFVRLNNPGYKKYGNGLRVKKIVIYDHWNAMTGRKEAMYGTEYSYTTVKNIDGVDKVISSGVATYEPVMGTEENPLRIPVEYNEQVSAWAPTNMGYVETPLGESFYPSASVGYSKVKTRSIHTKNTRSANGYEVTNFYTSYDFPTISDNSLLNNDTKRRYKPGLSNFLRIRAKHHLVMSQGFKVELNDMHGKVMSHYSYPETDTNYTSGTINYYHLDDQHAAVKHLNNTVFSMNAAGEIDTTTMIGKDMELMMDMREQKSSTNSISVDGNIDLFSFAIPPILGIPMVMIVPQSEETLFRSVAATKVISRHGILDSLVAIDKGSKVVTQNLLYDGETGDVLLTATQNEFGDSVYQFNYPAGWLYEGMSGAYKNINATLSNVNIKAGKIISNVSNATIAGCFTSGDEILIYARTKITEAGCSNSDSVLASFGSGSKIWAVDVNALNGGDPDIYFMQQDGTPYTGSDVTMKVVRSGRKNISASAGSVSMMKNPLVKVGNGYQLVIDKDSKIISAGVVEFEQNWQVEDRKKQKIICAY
jgi:hypothetical protein